MDYPDRPGSNVSGTGQDDGESIAGHAKTLRDRVLALLTNHYPASLGADEIAAALGESILTVRPRVSELRRSGLIEPSAERRLNKSGMRCWRAVVGSAGAA